MSQSLNSKLTGPRIGIIGGGQLAKMIALSGLQLGCEILVLERNPEAPAAHLASRYFVGDWDDPQTLAQLAAAVDVITLENEFVDAGSLETLEQAGHTLFPTAKSIGLVQDKFIQKQTLAKAGLPVPTFRLAKSTVDILEAGRQLNYPLLLKTCRNGYDGKGNTMVNHAGEVEAAWEKLHGDSQALYLEAFCPFVTELAIIITTGRDGEVATYPLVESVQQNHICHTVRAPAPVPEAVAEKAISLAQRAVAAVGAVGSFGVEMFLTQDQQIWLNELAPRVHNSGHYTIEACICSQFENHVRAILNLPLGSTTMLKPAAVMVNLLGGGEGNGYPIGLKQVLSMPGARLHVYGKAMSMANRKMGHINVLGEDLTVAEAKAKKAAERIQFGTET